MNQEKNDWKRDYLFKTFSRTATKSEEAYCLTAIWHELGNLDIQPVTQQYVRRSNGKYALIDLYFPQLNIGIESNEAYHQKGKNKINDLIRENEVWKILSSIDEHRKPEIWKIDSSQSIEEIESEIECIVSKLKERISKKAIQKWLSPKEKVEQIKSKGVLNVADDICFRTIVDICNNLFGRDYKGMQKCYFHLENEMQLWCPKLAIEQPGQSPIPGSGKGWINILSKDWNYIFESNINAEQNNKIDLSERPRITFAKSKNVLGQDVYRFIGVFRYSYEESKVAMQNVMKRESESIDLKQFINER